VSADASFPREIIGLAAERLMELDVSELKGLIPATAQSMSVLSASPAPGNGLFWSKASEIVLEQSRFSLGAIFARPTEISRGQRLPTQEVQSFMVFKGALVTI
jgi:hypothetical protein